MQPLLQYSQFEAGSKSIASNVNSPRRPLVIPAEIVDRRHDDFERGAKFVRNQRYEVGFELAQLALALERFFLLQLRLATLCDIDAERE